MFYLHLVYFLFYILFIFSYRRDTNTVLKDKLFLLFSLMTSRLSSIYGHTEWTKKINVKNEQNMEKWGNKYILEWYKRKRKQNIYIYVYTGRGETEENDRVRVRQDRTIKCTRMRKLTCLRLAFIETPARDRNLKVQAWAACHADRFKSKTCRIYKCAFVVATLDCILVYHWRVKQKK